MMAPTRRHPYSHRARRVTRGLGRASSTNSVVLRDRDADTSWRAASDADLDERRYYCQNWRADVSVILPSTGCDGSGPGILEWIKYSAYGVPQAFSMADYNRDGAANSSDFNGTTGAFDVDYGVGNLRADLNFDGGVTIDDLLLLAGAASESATRGTQSCASTQNRIGYAGYQWDPVTSVNHVRHRVYLPEMGRWTRRDPLGYVDGLGLYEYANSRVIVSADPLGKTGVTLTNLDFTIKPENGVFVERATWVVGVDEVPIRCRKSGWIVQHVVTSKAYISCGLAGPPGPNHSESFNYYEAWRVSWVGEVYIQERSRRTRGKPADFHGYNVNKDFFADTSVAFTRGEVHAWGELALFCDEDLVGQNNIPDNWDSPNEDGPARGRPSGSLLSTTTPPTWFDTWRVSASHSMQLQWSHCENGLWVDDRHGGHIQVDSVARGAAAGYPPSTGNGDNVYIPR